jgi:hypothetical protein
MGDSGVSVYGFVVFGVLLIIGIAMLNNVISSNSSGNNSTGFAEYQLNFTQNPIAGQIIMVDNNVFEFSSGGSVAPGCIAVQIGNTTADTVNNLKAAIQNNTAYGVS